MTRTVHDKNCQLLLKSRLESAVHFCMALNSLVCMEVNLCLKERNAKAFHDEGWAYNKHNNWPLALLLSQKKRFAYFYDFEIREAIAGHLYFIF